MTYTHTLGSTRYTFADLPTLLARASSLRSGDRLAGLAANTGRERVAAQLALADLPLSHFLHHHVIPYEVDDVTRLIIDTHDAAAFAPIRHLTVGDFRNWLLATTTTSAMLSAAAPGITPEMASAVCRLMQNQDLIAVARKCRVVTRFRTTIGLPGRLAIRLQPNHPTDDAKAIAASMLDGLFYGSGDAVIGINPAKDNLPTVIRLLRMLDDFRTTYEAPIQSCVLTHLTTTLDAIHAGAPVDLVFQSIGGTEATNRSFGISLAMLQEGYDAGRSLNRGAICADGSLGTNVMYFETGQGSSLSANAHHGVDQQTCEARAYAVARHYHPLLVNSVVGFIGPEYLYDGKQIIRAGLEDHFCGKLLGLPMGCDVCYTNHAEVDQNDMDTLLTLLGVAGINFVMGVPGADDIMLGYQSTSFHDALYLRQVLGLKRAPEFEQWLERANITNAAGELRTDNKSKLQQYQAQIETPAEVPIKAKSSLNEPQAPVSSDSILEAAMRVPQVSNLRPGSQPTNNLPPNPQSSDLSSRPERPGSPAHGLCVLGWGSGVEGSVVPTPAASLPDHDKSLVTRNGWQSLQAFTHARIALGRTGDSLPTQPALAFQLAHAEARDAVHYTFNLEALTTSLEAKGLPAITVQSNAPDRTTYLQQPGLGRTLASASLSLLREKRGSLPFDLVFVIADGLCPLAVEHHAIQLIDHFRQLHPECRLGPAIVAAQARVALGDQIGEALNTAAVAVLIGERPGLSSPDSLGIYLTWNPRSGLTDADRNCISNIHSRGMSTELAARKLIALLAGAHRLGASGTQLHDNQLDDAPSPPRQLPPTPR